MPNTVRAITRLRDADDFEGTLADGLFLRYDLATDQFDLAAAGVTDHGALTGLTDDDHTQYALANGSRAFTGGITLPAATASTPAVQIGAGGSTGLYSPASWQVAITTANQVCATFTSTATTFNKAPRVGAGTDLSILGGHVAITQNDASDHLLALNAAAAQSGNLIQATSSGGSAGDLFSVGPKGGVFVGTGTGPWYFDGGIKFRAADGTNARIYSSQTQQINFAIGNANVASLNATRLWVESGKGLRVVNGALEHQAGTVGLFGATPVSQQAHIADPAADTTELATAVAAILDALEAFGFLATS